MYMLAFYCRMLLQNKSILLVRKMSRRRTGRKPLFPILFIIGVPTVHVVLAHAASVPVFGHIDLIVPRN